MVDKEKDIEKVFEHASKVVAVHSEDEEILKIRKKLIEDGNVTTLTTSGNVTLTFTNFPLEDDASTNVHASMRVFLTKGTSTHTVTLTGVSFPTVASFVESNLDSSTMSTTFPDRKSTFVFDVFSVDGGTTKFISTILEYPSST
mgnify:CR=1 FL=1